MSHKTTTKLRKLRGSMAQTTMEYQDPLGATFQAELRERRRRRRRRRGFSLEVCVRVRASQHHSTRPGGARVE